MLALLLDSQIFNLPDNVSVSLSTCLPACLATCLAACQHVRSCSCWSTPLFMTSYHLKQTSSCVSLTAAYCSLLPGDFLKFLYTVQVPAWACQSSPPPPQKPAVGQHGATGVATMYPCCLYGAGRKDFDAGKSISWPLEGVGHENRDFFGALK